MKQNIAKLVNSYAIAIFTSTQKSEKTLETILLELNVIENILQNYNTNSFNEKSFFSVINQLKINPITKNILLILSQKSRLELVSLIVDALRNKIEFTFSKPIAVIYAPSAEVASKIKSEKFASNITIFKKSSKIVVLLNNKVVDFSLQARLMSLQSQVLKNLSNI